MHGGAARACGPASRRGASRTSRWATLDSWSRERRVVGKAEGTGGEANPRFVVTSLQAAPRSAARHLYEKIYCARGEMENRIKECQLDLFADRTSAATMRANQLRLWFASMAYVLLCALAPHRPGAHAVRRGHLRHHPAEAAEDRRPGAHQRAPHQDRHGLGLSLAGRVRAGASPGCAAPPPDTNQTAHSRHATATTPPNWRRWRSLPAMRQPHHLATPAACHASAATNPLYSRS